MGDEFGTIWLVRHSGISDILRIAQADVNPPTHYLLLHWWSGLWGSEEWWLRLFSVLPVFAALPIVASLTRRVFGPTSVLIAVLFTLASPTVLAAAHMARYYTFGMLAGLLAVWAFMRWWDRRTAVWACACGASLALAWYIHYVLGAGLACGELTFLVATGAWRRPRAIAGWAWAQIGAAAVVAPLVAWDLVSASRELGGRPGNAVSLAKVAIRIGVYVGGEVYAVVAGTVLYPWFFWATVPAVVACAYLLWRGWGRANVEQRAFVVAFVIVPTVVTAVIVARFAAIVAPLEAVKRSLVVLPVAWMCAAFGALAPPSGRGRSVALVAVLVASGYSFVHYLADYRGPSASGPLKAIAATIAGACGPPAAELVFDPFSHGWGSALGMYLPGYRVTSLAAGWSNGIGSEAAESLVIAERPERVWIVRANRWPETADRLRDSLLTHGYRRGLEMPVLAQDAYSRWFKARLAPLGFSGPTSALEAAYFYTLASFEGAVPPVRDTTGAAPCSRGHSETVGSLRRGS
jgi:4-amino-4-deoxy-L-arabinose transferase-like glycosyltransferase